MFIIYNKIHSIWLTAYQWAETVDIPDPAGWKYAGGWTPLQ